MPDDPATFPRGVPCVGRLRLCARMSGRGGRESLSGVVPRAESPPTTPSAPRPAATLLLIRTSLAPLGLVVLSPSGSTLGGNVSWQSMLRVCPIVLSIRMYLPNPGCRRPGTREPRCFVVVEISRGGGCRRGSGSTSKRGSFSCVVVGAPGPPNPKHEPCSPARRVAVCFLLLLILLILLLPFLPLQTPCFSCSPAAPPGPCGALVPPLACVAVPLSLAPPFPRHAL